MHPNVYLSPLVICLAMTLSSTVKSAQPMLLDKANLKEFQQKFALPTSSKVAAMVSSNTEGYLKLVKQHKDFNHINHIRMQQTYAGFEVIGGYAVIHRGLSTTDVNGIVYKNLERDLGLVAADFISNGDLALENFKSSYDTSIMSEEQVRPVIYIDNQQQAHWAYRVSVFLTHNDKIPERPTAIVDASTFKPYVSWNEVKSSRVPVKGMGVGGNEKIGKFYFDGVNLPFLNILRDPKLNKCYMENDDTRVVDMQHRTSAWDAPMKFTCKSPLNSDPNIFWTGYKSDGHDDCRGAFSPSNDALYAGYVIKHMYADWYNIEVLTKADGSPMKLVMRVHYGDSYENAFWDGKQMTFGDGAGVMYPLVSVGVGAHEISHGFTEQNSDLEYYGQSGGINESFSDMAAQASEYYIYGKSSWMIGSEITKVGSGVEALRYMDVPSKDGSSIDTADAYHPKLDVHHTSGVYNRLFYLMANLPNWNPRKAFEVMIKANMDYWTPYTDYEQGACGILSAATDLGYDQSGIKNSLDTVRINYQRC